MQRRKRWPGWRRASPDADQDAYQADGLAYARGEMAWARGDLKGAIEQLSKCLGEDDLCRFRLAAAQEKAGDKAAAAATRKSILDAHHGGKFRAARPRLADGTAEGAKKGGPPRVANTFRGKPTRAAHICARGSADGRPGADRQRHSGADRWVF